MKFLQYPRYFIECMKWWVSNWWAAMVLIGLYVGVMTMYALVVIFFAHVGLQLLKDWGW